VTGLEIGMTHAIAAQAKPLGGRIVTERAAARPLPVGTLRDGVVVDPDGLARELKELFSEHGFAKRVRVGLATPRTIVRVVDLPPLEERDIAAALRMQAAEQIPMPLDRAVMDFQAVGLVDTPAGQRMRVIVVVTERESVERMLEALRRAGLRAAGIDVSSFALIRALSDREDAGRPVLYAQLGDFANIAIAEAGVCRFTRLSQHGLATLLERLMVSQRLSVGEALALLESGSAEHARAEIDDRSEAVDRVLSRTAQELGSDIRAAAEFYSTQFASAPVATGVLAGPLAAAPGFIDALAASSGLELRCGEATPAPAGALQGIDPRLAPLASGLAVAEVSR
jgi:type IV pilus assembly protein PilM